MTDKQLKTLRSLLHTHYSMGYMEGSKTDEYMGKSKLNTREESYELEMEVASMLSNQKHGMSSRDASSLMALIYEYVHAAERNKFMECYGCDNAKVYYSNKKKIRLYEVRIRNLLEEVFR